MNDYEQILTHRTGDIVRGAVLATTVCAFTFWLSAPAGIVIACSVLALVPAVALSWRQVRVFGPRNDEVLTPIFNTPITVINGPDGLLACYH